MTQVATSFQALGSIVAIKQDVAEEFSPGGIALPEASKKAPRRGTVVSAGSGTVNDRGQRIPLEVSEGDRVVFSETYGATFEIEGEDYILIDAKDIFAVIK